MTAIAVGEVEPSEFERKRELRGGGETEGKACYCTETDEPPASVRPGSRLLRRQVNGLSLNGQGHEPIGKPD